MTDDESDMECNDIDMEYEYYDDMCGDIEQTDCTKDLEYFDYECLALVEAEMLLNQLVDPVATQLKLPPSLAKLLLHSHKWTESYLVDRYKEDAHKLLVDSKIEPDIPIQFTQEKLSRTKCVTCNICFETYTGDCFRMLTCGHHFCNECWASHFETQIRQNVSTGIQCMSHQCTILVPEDVVMDSLLKPQLKEKYMQYVFSDYIKSHPQLMMCPNGDCSNVIRAKENKARRVVCRCKATFCFKCGGEYHAPTDCMTIKKWLTKCADDSETANYISVHTKDCPKCHTCIEKNGGCNHMQCTCCKHDFCWICQGDWKNHGSEYYECSRYKEKGSSSDGVVAARDALKKYLHYYERWENHAKSLRLEEQTTQKIKARIQEMVASKTGTWIDWQYLLDGATLLAKCRYTLQYTYPYAYYMDPGPRKSLFEYQQSQLEAEIENLSWKIERAESTDRGDLENQMNIAEKRRSSLLRDFQES